MQVFIISINHLEYKITTEKYVQAALEIRGRYVPAKVRET